MGSLSLFIYTIQQLLFGISEIVVYNFDNFVITFVGIKVCTLV